MFYIGNIDNNELLKYVIENGMIDVPSVQTKIEMEKREELLSKHPYKIYQENSGRYCVYLPDKDKGRILVKKKNKKDIEDVIISYWKDELESPTLEVIFYEWLNEKLENMDICKGTYDRYENDFKRFFKDQRNFGGQKIKNIEEEDVENFIKKSIATHKLTTKGYANLRLITLGLFKKAKKKKYITWSITEVIKDMEISKKSFTQIIKEDYEEVFNERETEIMLNYLCENIDLYNMALILLFVTGLRIGELVALKWEAVDGKAIKIKRMEIKYKDEKGNLVYEIKEFPKTRAGYRTAIVPKDYMWVLKKIRAMNPFGNFVFEQNETWVRTYMISDRLRNLCKKLSIHHKSPHKIRKTYGTILLDNHVDSNLVEKLMGHTTIGTTEEYYHRNRKDLDKQAAIVSSIPDFVKTKKTAI